jgi:hypothetical protein
MDRLLKRLQEEIASAIAGLSPGQLNLHPVGKWCTSEVLEHLYLTYTGTIKGFSLVLEAQKVKVTPPTWKLRRNKLVVLGFGYLPPGREAPPFARPRGLPVENVLPAIVPKMGEMDDIIARCEQGLGRGILLDHPILGPLTGRAVEKVSSGARSASSGGGCPHVACENPDKS